MTQRQSPVTSPSPANTAGFTIVEILMVFIIIGVLTAILVPVVANRSREARVTAAQSDLERLSDAEERAAIDTGYFYRPYALNDVRGGDGVNPNALSNLTASPTGLNSQGILDNVLQPNNYYETPGKIFIYATGAGSGDYSNNYLDLFKIMASNETGFNWNGPYINWHSDSNRNDWPDDPWGRDYLLFTKRGAIFPPQRDAQNVAGRPDTSATFQQSVTLGSYTYGALDQYFDRPTFVSLGPDGLPGDGTDPATSANNDFPGKFGRGDDVVRTFGGN